ncbi:hypothetical protein EDC27_2118 [Desulfosoma caldarium]|uniref:Uncharacterized protein n=1 Tax=Desulfosoma caldarium TaxID=610254 RepID=A0A3N1UL91_9BACT|nr:hypothetical protein EDC27_2118 [Desulfosoma caldarium]
MQGRCTRLKVIAAGARRPDLWAFLKRSPSCSALKEPHVCLVGRRAVAHEKRRKKKKNLKEANGQFSFPVDFAPKRWFLPLIFSFSDLPGNLKAFRKC